MMRVPLALTLAALAGAAPAAAQPQLAAPVDYAKSANWLCLPGRSDFCDAPLDTIALNANGYGPREPLRSVPNPAVDCFYVYPTVSLDQGLNSDLSPGPEERAAVQLQFARFASVCRPFAPLYRQMTVASIAAMTLGTNILPAAQIAYGDVAAAWRVYLTRYNRGRPFVLIGHSQGSALLIQLIAREIEGKPVARRMKLAILPGYNVLVPEGRRVGGSFASTPLCNSPGETGCVLSWTSYRERNLPPPGALFGFADRPGMTVGCVNPARPGSSAWEDLDSYWYTRSDNPVPGGPIRWSSEGPPPTRFVHTRGLVSARCEHAGPRGYLSIRTNHRPGDKRTARIGGEVAVMGMFIPGWGMHLADIAEAQGDLIRAVAALTPRPRTAPRR